MLPEEIAVRPIRKEMFSIVGIKRDRKGTEQRYFFVNLRCCVAFCVLKKIENRENARHFKLLDAVACFSFSDDSLYDRSLTWYRGLKILLEVS